jgi:hypothetical protein
MYLIYNYATYKVNIIMLKCHYTRRRNDEIPMTPKGNAQNPWILSSAKNPRSSKSWIKRSWPINPGRNIFRGKTTIIHSESMPNLIL